MRRKHPWVFSGALQSELKIASGSIVDVYSAKSEFIGRGYANPNSGLCIRILTWNKDETIDHGFWFRRIDSAYKRRRHLQQQGYSNAMRVVFSDGDELPGLILDKYGDWIVLQSLSSGIDAHLPMIVDAVTKIFSPKGIYERSDESIRELERLPPRKQILYGEPCEKNIFILSESSESGDWQAKVDLWEGHKTGFYLDQRRNRRLVARRAKGKTVLNCFSYTGGFSLACLRAGAEHVLSVDSSAPALEILEQNRILNRFKSQSFESTQADVFSYLRSLLQHDRKFDVIVLDPPKLAPSAKNIESASRAYKDLNMQAMKLLRSGGELATFSCSSHISEDLLQKILFAASQDSRVSMQIIETLSQDEDHPIHLNVPETRYLKGFILRRTE